MVIDHHAHWFPPQIFDVLLRRTASPRCELHAGKVVLYDLPNGSKPLPIGPEFVDIDEQLRLMTEAGVDAMLASTAQIADLSLYELGEAREIAAIVNEAYSDMQRREPGRFFGLATLPIQDVDAALDSLNDAYTRLGLRGVSLNSNVAGKPLALPEFRPVFQRIEELGLPIVLHPTRSIPAPAFDYWDRQIDISIGYLFDTSAAVLSLIMGGVLDEFPTLQIVQPHLGGIIPYCIRRINYTNKFVSTGDRSYTDYLRRNFYTDTACHDPGALQLAIDTFGEDRILFGTDMPYKSRSSGIEYLKQNLDSDTAGKIMNAVLPMGN